MTASAPAPDQVLSPPIHPAVSIQGVRKLFGTGDTAVRAVDGVDLDILDGEFFCLLGPSGSGKTTLLRMIAGFELPTDGTILLQGTDVTRLPPFDRDVNTVFQDYALFPHMSVADNVGYGLKVKKVPKAERVRRVGEALDTVQLGAYGARKPSQLSGGQRQRIALARALINRPKVLLLDVAGAAAGSTVAAAAGGDGKRRGRGRIKLHRLGRFHANGMGRSVHRCRQGQAPQLHVAVDGSHHQSRRERSSHRPVHQRRRVVRSLIRLPD